MPSNTEDTVIPERRAYNLRTAFQLLHISESFGHALIKAGRIRTVRLGPGSPRITDFEIARILDQGLVPTEKPTSRRSPTRRTSSIRKAAAQQS